MAESALGRPVTPPPGSPRARRDGPKFDGCSGFPDGLFGVVYVDLCWEHDGADMRRLHMTGEHRARQGASYVNGGPLWAKARIDLVFAAKLLWRGLTARRRWFWWACWPLWWILAPGAWLAVTVIGGPWTPAWVARALNKGRDFRWGHVCLA